MMGWFGTGCIHRRTSEGFIGESERRCGGTRFRFGLLGIESVKALPNKVFDVLGELLCVHRRTSANLQKPIVFVEVRRCFTLTGFEAGDRAVFKRICVMFLEVRRFEGWNPYWVKALRRTPYRWV
ncbi:MAG: hypothetical protein HC849_05690 [Oscillatoriales cyanobacterium RU_3_3]|nr:hypothetical protein [Microcoleus sp. SU_5_3]NJL66261.1 hypothetical protein [Microcoleus sp. SM1_3_4]NJM59796.1 hypothetical protein [Oscillatoriales cyanobacterium RU_3_3]